MMEGNTEKKKVVPIVIDGFEINNRNISFNKLQEFSLTLLEKFKRHRKERNLLVSERDKLRILFDNTRHEINVANAVMVSSNDKLEQDEAEHLKQLKEIGQEEKYILYDHNLNLSDIKTWGEDLLDRTEAEDLQEESELLDEKRQLKVKLDEQKTAHEEALESLTNKNAEEIERLRQSQEEGLEEKEKNFKKNFATSVEYFTIKHQMEMSELEESMNTHIDQLKRNSNKRIDKIKEFFNSVTAENVQVISNLKQSVEHLRKNRVLMSNKVGQLKRANKKLQQDVDKSNSEVKNLTRQVVNYKKDLLSLKHNKAMLKQTINDIDKVNTQTSETLNKIMSTPTLWSVNNLPGFNRFQSAVHKKFAIEKVISNLIELLRKKQNRLKTISNDPKLKQSLSKLKWEYWNPRKLSYQLAVICKAHDDLLKTLWKILQDHCLTENYLGSSLLDVEKIGKYPSNFVSNQDY